MSENDARSIADMCVAIGDACAAQGIDPAAADIQLSAAQYTPLAELYLRHLGAWERLLLVRSVRVSIGGPYEWPPPRSQASAVSDPSGSMPP